MLHIIITIRRISSYLALLKSDTWYTGTCVVFRIPTSAYWPLMWEQKHHTITIVCNERKSTIWKFKKSKILLFARWQFCRTFSQKLSPFSFHLSSRFGFACIIILSWLMLLSSFSDLTVWINSNVFSCLLDIYLGKNGLWYDQSIIFLPPSCLKKVFCKNIPLSLESLHPDHSERVGTSFRSRQKHFCLYH